MSKFLRHGLPSLLVVNEFIRITIRFKEDIFSKYILKEKKISF